MPPTTAGGAVTRQLWVPFAAGTWLAQRPSSVGARTALLANQIMIYGRRKGNGKATAAANPANLQACHLRQVL
jgi:hypothetical protein